MARGIDRLSPILPRSPMLIKHRPSHLTKSSILSLNNTVLTSNIWRRKLMFKTKISAKRLKTSILELRAIVTAYSSHGFSIALIFQPQDQIAHKAKGLILRSHGKHPSIAREIINHHENIPFPTN